MSGLRGSIACAALVVAAACNRGQDAGQDTPARASPTAPATPPPEPAARAASETPPPAPLLPVPAPQHATSLPLHKLHVPGGFAVEVFAEGVENARSMTRGTGGTIFVGTRKSDRVHALVDADADGRAERVVTVASGLEVPNGVAFRDGSLYVGQVHRILRYDDIERRLDDPPEPVVVTDTYPTRGHHGWKYIAFGPDGWLYVPVGAPCNVCLEDDEIFATITRMRPDGTGREIFARGVRNTVGFDWNPRNGELWFTDNGRDMLGDDIPPDELNRAHRPGLHFGFPHCHAGEIPDPEHGKRGCAEFVPPAQKLGPHVASLGMKFYTGTMFPEGYRGQIFLAEHGSWNRSKRIGYRISLVRHDDVKGTSYEPFIEGWLQGEEPWGRPVDVLVMPDGALLVSDDMAGAVYRVSYGAAASDPAAGNAP